MNTVKGICSLGGLFNRQKSLVWIMCILIPCFLLSAGLTGCSKVEVEPDSGTSGGGTTTTTQPAAITLSISDPNIVIGSSFPMITALVSDINGDPVGSGFMINFSVFPITAATLSSSSNTTSLTGEASVFLNPQEPGGAVVTAMYSGGVTESLPITIVGDPNAAADPNSTPTTPSSGATGVMNSIQIATGSEQIVADGVSIAAISATVLDTAGVFMPDATTFVTFTTTAGDIDPDIAGVQSSYTTNPTNGVARTTLRSSTNKGIATIIASCDGFNDFDTIEFIAGQTATLLVSANPDTLIADSNNVVGESSIMIAAYDAFNNPVENETELTLSANYGSLSTFLVFTSDGEAGVTYTAPGTSPPGGTATVTVEAPNELTNSVIIYLSAVSGDPNAPTYPIGSITISSGSQKIVADGTSSLTVSATVKDTLGVNIPNGTPVTFTTTAGDLDPNTALVQDTVTLTTTSGIARATLRSSTRTGTVTITAETGGYNASTTVKFIPGPDASVIMDASPADLMADGETTSTITATVLDLFNNPVPDITLTFDAMDGTLEKNIGTTDTEGRCTNTYTSPGYVPAGGVDTVTAETTNNISGSALINLSGAQVASITLTAEPSSLPADGTSKSTITASVTIVGGGTTPDDTPVAFSIVSGGGSFQVTGTTTTTSYTAGGEAQARLISDPNVGTATIQATSGGITEEIQITYTPGSVTLTITPNSLLGTGDETANVIATLTDATGSPAADGEDVVFSLSDGTLGSLVDLSGVSITDPNGVATAATSGGQGKVNVVFEASNKDGTITITATWSPGGISISGSATATILPSPADIRMADGFPDPTSISIKGTGGISTSRLTFDVSDAHSEPVPDGYRIDFAIQSGPNGGETIVPMSALTQNGQVTTLLRSGTKAGPVSIKAYYYNDSKVTTTTSSIAISAGPPVGEEFGISAEFKNVSGYWIIGLEDDITIHAGDISGNPVPDDTAISFKTYNTGGIMVPGSSQTVDGATTSTLVSTSPTPQQGFLPVTAEATNGGRTTHVTCIEVTPSPDNEIIYAGTDGGGVYKSTDGGYSWNTVSRSSAPTMSGQNWIDPYVNDVAVDPDSFNTVYAATGYLGKGNVYRSLDGGLNWNSDDPEEWNGILSAGKAVLTILCDDGGSPYVWVGIDGLGALFASDGEDFGWGGVVNPSGGTAENVGGDYFFDAAKGVMSKPTLSQASKTETWTVIFNKTDAYLDDNPYSDPEDAIYLYDSPLGSNANGYMDTMDADTPADTETWTVTYVGGYDPTDPVNSNPANYLLAG
ncbi:MAG: Ig-like domain-containing protein, partial [bacterium]